jgi:hypothetical protein
MNTTLKITIAIGLAALVTLVLPTDVMAQCPMCKATAETNMNGGGTAGAGLNAGILYMLIMPYLLVGGIAFWWWRNRRIINLPDELSNVQDLEG